MENNLLRRAVLSRACMGARQPRPRRKRPKKQVTVPWKRRVIAQIEQNERDQTATGVVDRKKPANVEQLRKLVGASKKALNRLFDLELDPPQLSNDRVDEITGVLGVAPPLLETEDDDDDLSAVVHVLRRLTKEARRDLMKIAESLPKK